MSTYVRMGRGGVGNHISKEELLKQASEDLEAQNKSAKRLSTANQLAQEELESPPPGEYKHMGRGGAGNWYTPSELSATGTTTAPTDGDDTTEIPPSQAQTHSTRQWVGRGGAGNFAGQAEQQPQKIEEIELQERERAHKLEEEVRRSVDSSLPKPGSAHLGGAK